MATEEKKMRERTNWELLARSLAGECSKEEKAEVEAWLNSDRENQRLMKSLKSIWNAPETQPQKSDIKKLWIETIVKPC